MLSRNSYPSKLKISDHHGNVDRELEPASSAALVKLVGKAALGYESAFGTPGGDCLAIAKRMAGPLLLPPLPLPSPCPRPRSPTG